MKTSQRIIGFKDSGRRVADFYPTPHYVLDGLLRNENFEGSIWEPACGDGAISGVLEARGFTVTSTDIIYRGYGKGEVDFLQESTFDARHFVHDNIITNPPFNKANEFLLMSKRYARKKIALLLKTTFLEGGARYKILTDKSFPLKCMYQFVKRVQFSGNAGASGMISFAWFVWDKEHVGEPFIRWTK